MEIIRAAPGKAATGDFFSPFSTPYSRTFFRACGLVMGTGDEDCPEALLAWVDTALADLIVPAAAVLPRKKDHSSRHFLLRLIGHARGLLLLGPVRGLRSPHSRLASASRSRMEGRFSGVALRASPWAFSCSSPLRPLFSTPSIIP